MSDIDYLRIIKWVLIVLLAGFIGQFGKSFAKYIMERTRRKKEAEMAAPAESDGAEASPPATSTGAGESGKAGEEELSAELAQEEAKKKKKELKARAKLEKKEAKAAQKEGK
jgi:flagellar biosynthesis/type III secretory pathway M-ring protein FliF/YscJ